MRETYKEAIREALAEELERDDSVLLLGEDVAQYGGGFGVTDGLLERFGSSRVVNMPIAENAFVNMAVGAAMMGKRPVVELMFSDFAAVAMDAIADQAAKVKFLSGGQFQAPLVIRTAAGAGTCAAAQHSQSLEAWLCHIPGLIVMAPSCAYDAKGLLKAAIRCDSPVVFLEHKLCYGLEGNLPEIDYTLPIGKGAVKRKGRDITIISYSHMVRTCLEAAAMLSKRRGIEAEVIDLRTILPLDRNLIVKSVKKTGLAMVVHEAVKDFGIGAEISATINESDCFYSLKKPVARLGSAFMPVPFGEGLERAFMPQVEQIAAKAEDMVASCFGRAASYSR